MNKPFFLKDRFLGQVAVITGGADGLGKAIAFRLLNEGAKVALLDVNEQKLNETIVFFQGLKLEAIGYKVDVSNELDVKNSFEKIYSQFGKIDIMINCAGIVGSSGISILEYSVEVFDRVYAVNLRAAFLVMKYALNYMDKQQYGRILMIASMAGKDGNPNMVGYSSTKAGVMGMVKGIAKEFADKRITVNGLAPAVIRTAMNEDTDPNQLTYMLSKIPMGRLGTVEEVAAISSYIVSEENSFSTGFIYDISGGRATY